MANKGSIQAAKGMNLAQLRQENFELKRMLGQLQPQAQQAMYQAAESQGRYLHMLKLFSAAVIQNMAAGIETIIDHKTLVDLPEVLNIGRDPVKTADGKETGYKYTMLTDEQVAQKRAEAESGGTDTERPDDSSPGLVVPATS